MKSSEGSYYIGLDHIRAVAAYLVFSWHYLSPLNLPPSFPFSIISEGHVGVSLFMTLSGYLFAKLLANNEIDYVKFLYNRIIRLLPLLLIVLLMVGVIKWLSDENMSDYIYSLKIGLIYPSLPNGGWSIIVEFYFYLILPLLLYFMKRDNYSLFLCIVVMIIIRIAIYQYYGSVQNFSYFTIIGRMDQFILGLLGYKFSQTIKNKNYLFYFTLISILVFYWYFDYLGGFYAYGGYPSTAMLWIYLPTIEGALLTVIIAWYDNSVEPSKSKISTFIARIGTYSYSIYLLHFFFVFKLSEMMNNFVGGISNIYTGMLLSTLGFIMILPITHYSYKYIERPALNYRKRYIINKIA